MSVEPAGTLASQWAAKQPAGSFQTTPGVHFFRA